VEGRWDLLMVFDAPHSREAEGRTVQALADESGRNPWDVVCDLLLAEWENPTALFWSAPIHQQEDVDTAFRHDRCLIMSDGADVAMDGPYAEVRDIYAYGWAAHVLRRYVRERHVLSLEQAVRKLSGLAAERLGLHDRGLIAPGRKADIVVFDASAVQDRATRQQPIAYADGIRRVWVNGVLTVADGQHTGALAGHVLRRG
jgi:N-acyl-D-amino-acid deacylase